MMYNKQPNKFNTKIDTYRPFPRFVDDCKSMAVKTKQTIDPTAKMMDTKYFIALLCLSSSALYYYICLPASASLPLPQDREENNENTMGKRGN